MSISDHLQAQLDSLPTKTGCYIMKNAEGRIIYIGKAINLRSRVRSYFHASQTDNKTRQLVRHIREIEWIIVDSELEALILEMNLIKRHRPQYNVRMKDDKRYPYIKVHWADPYPKVTVTRQISKNDGMRYYGPYTSAWAVYQTLDVLRRVFPYLTCDREINGQDSRACLYYDIKLCLAPCIAAVSQKQYRQMIDDLCKFLEGHSEPILARIQDEMSQAAESLRFEKAAALRDQLRALDHIVSRQKVIFSSDYVDSDVIAMARSNEPGSGDLACVQVFFIRGGKLIGREYFVMEGAEETPDASVLAEFLKQFYDETPSVPAQLLLPNEVEEAQVIREWLNSRRGDKVEIHVPRDSQQADLVEMAAQNAAETLTALKSRWENDTHRQEQALQDLQDALNLPSPPNRIECYDISNTQGVLAVGSMVVFEQGAPQKSHYRRFNIRTVQGPDDFASMEEVLRRRFGRWKTLQEAEKSDQPGKKQDRSFQRLPDLLIVDGGKGQLSRAVKVLDEFGLLEAVPVAGLAKQDEELFVPHQAESILLPRQSQGLYLVQRVRDEAHRFAITAHRGRRDKQGIASRLDMIPGIGPKRRKALLLHFGDIEAIRQATVEQITDVDGINLELAESIKGNLE